MKISIVKCYLCFLPFAMLHYFGLNLKFSLPNMYTEISSTKSIMSKIWMVSNSFSSFFIFLLWCYAIFCGADDCHLCSINDPCNLFQRVNSKWVFQIPHSPKKKKPLIYIFSWSKLDSFKKGRKDRNFYQYRIQQCLNFNSQ